MSKLLIPLQSFYTMHLFLENYFNATSSDSIGALLGCMHFLDDGETADPALWEDWREIVGNDPISLMQAFQAMKIFLDTYYQATSSTNVKNMLADISLVIDDKPGKERIWQKWIASVDLALE
ncbi:MAG TPA: hypothetical protein VJ201_05930 [Candidatus Babeliales bacterium]|nr:hypothetical protein [Candidatus Babeliales bacterium]HLC06810.1 hypothetical protein [Candidatus Babeliales bacterium]